MTTSATRRSAVMAWPDPPPLRATEIALFHDVDGTLLELAPEPDQVCVASYLPGLLTQLREELGGALAVVTGRSLATIDRLLDPATLAGAGLHGAELRRRPGGDILRDDALAPQGVAEALRHYFADDPRILIEDKGLSVALHYRQAPERWAECEAVASALASAMGFGAAEGKLVMEILPAAANKGRAVRTLMESAPFAGRMPVFVGDDLTDENGILVVQAMGGYGIKVGAGPSAAKYRLRGIDEVHRWLAAGARLRDFRP